MLEEKWAKTYKKMELPPEGKLVERTLMHCYVGPAATADTLCAYAHRLKTDDKLRYEPQTDEVSKTKSETVSRRHSLLDLRSARRRTNHSKHLAVRLYHKLRFSPHIRDFKTAEGSLTRRRMQQRIRQRNTDERNPRRNEKMNIHPPHDTSFVKEGFLARGYAAVPLRRRDEQRKSILGERKRKLVVSGLAGNSVMHICSGSTHTNPTREYSHTYGKGTRHVYRG